jgi:sugar phosphate isomerase/epimerase
MKLAFSTNAFKKVSLEQAVDEIASIGYAGVEIMADVPHAYPSHMSAGRITALREQIARLKLGLSNINAFTLFAAGDTYNPTWIDPDPEVRRRRIRHTADCIRLAQALGARTVSLQPGGPLGDAKPDAALELYQQGLLELLPLAASSGVTLLVEPEPGLLIENSRQCVEFLEKISHPNLKMNCDLGHFFCVGENPAEVLTNSRDWISHVHAEDIGANRVHQHLVPGRGAMPWAQIIDALRLIDYTGWVTVELYPYESTAQEAAHEAFAFMQRYF